MLSYRWQDGFVSPYVPTKPEFLEELLLSLTRIEAARGQPLNGLIDLGSGLGDILDAVACGSVENSVAECAPAIRGPLIGVELDGELVKRSKVRLESAASARVVRGDIVTGEI